MIRYLLVNVKAPNFYTLTFIMLYIVLFYLFKSIYGMQINIKIL